jgi:hypothetical protein
MPPEGFRQVMQCADAVLSPNVIASSSLRAASMKIPVAMLHLGQGAPAPVAGTRMGNAVREFLDSAGPCYASSVWPLGFHGLMECILRENPFYGIQDHLDALDAENAAQRLAQLLAGGAAADGLRHRQSEYFSLLEERMDTPDRALEAALETP